MATITKKVQVCDLNHGGDDVEAVGKIEIHLPSGQTWKPDACAEHVAAVTELMQSFETKKARPSRATAPAKASRPARRHRAAKKRPARNPDAPAIRAWARDNGHQIPERGRMPIEIVDAFYAQQKKAPAKGRKATA